MYTPSMKRLAPTFWNHTVEPAALIFAMVGSSMGTALLIIVTSSRLQAPTQDGRLMEETILIPGMLFICCRCSRSACLRHHETERFQVDCGYRFANQWQGGCQRIHQFINRVFAPMLVLLQAAILE